MAKKLTAALLGLALAGTMMPANVLAEDVAEELTLKGFNATRSAITVDLNNVTDALDASSVDGRIYLQKRDAYGEISEVTDFTVDVTEKMSGTDANGAEVTTSAGNTVIITPAEGIEEGSLYHLTLYAGISDSDETILEDDIKTGWFEVKELFADDFNAEGHYTRTVADDGTVTATADYPYYWDSTNTYLWSKKWTLPANNLQIGNTTAKHNYTDYSVLRWIGNDRTAVVSEEGFPAAKWETDYTVEYVYQYPGYANGGVHYVAMGSSQGVKGYRLQLRNGTATASNLAADAKLYVGGNVSMVVPSFAPETSKVKIRMSAVGDNVQCYVDNARLFDINDSNYRSAGTATFFDKNSTTYWAPSYIDDVSITKVVNYGEIDFSGIVYESFNATKKVITLDFSGVNGKLDVESVTDRLEIIKKSADGEEEYVSDYTVESEDSYVDGDGNIVITLVDGIDTTAKYNVTVYGGISDATGVIMEEDATTGWFMVEELFADDFNANGKFNSTEFTAEYPYYWDSTNTYILSKNWDFSDAAAKLHIGNATNKHNYTDYNVLRWTNGAGATISQEAYPSSEWVTDYTVEYTYQYPGYANNGSHTVAMGSGKGGSGYKLQLRNNKATASSLAADAKLYVGGKVVETVPNFAPAAAKVDIRMSAIGDNIQLYIDNAKLFDIHDNTHRSAGTVTFGDSCAITHWNPSYIDDVSVTKVVSLEGIPESSDVLSYNADTDTVYVELDKADLDGNALADGALGGVKLYDKDGKEMNASVSLQGNWILVKPETKLDIKKKYTVEVKGLTTKYGTIINDYSKDFQLVKVYAETFDSEESVTESWSTRGIGSWDNGQMRLYNQKEATWQNAVDYIYSNKFTGTAEAEYVTEFDLYVYDNDSDANNALMFNELTFYSNKKHATAYNQGANTLNYGIGATRSFSVSTGSLVTLYSAAKSENFTLTAGGKYNVKVVNKNGTGFFYVNDVLEATYDYSEIAPLMTGCLGFKVGGQTNAGVDNILCTYATDYVDDGNEGATPEIAITEATVSAPSETGVVTADVTVQNNTYAGKNYVVAVAVYDVNNNLLGVKTASESNATAGTTKEYNGLTIENAGAISYAKVFLWDGLGTMNPIGTMREISGTTELAFYVNPSADLMSADGSLENPYPSINMAMERVKSEVDSGAFNVDFTINVADGDVVLDDTLVINDYKGILKSAGVTVTIQGEGTDKTFVKSGKVINNGDFYKVTDNSILLRVPSSARSYIYAVDLVKKGYVKNGEGLELALNGKVQTVAKYPNSGYLVTGSITDDGMGFKCSDSRVNSWETADDMYVYYMPNYFSYAYQVTAKNRYIQTANNAGFATGKNYYVYNLIEELDKENEYYYDKTAGVLYIYSTTTPTAKYEIFNMEKNLISLEYCDNVKIKNMTIENNGETLVSIRHTKNSGLENCVLRNGTKNAANISSGTNSGLLNCEIYDMGKGGVSLSGGNRDTLAKARNYVNKCAIHDCQRLDRSYTALVSMSGVGNYLVNSDIYNSYHQAITIYGNDLEVMNNKIYNVCTETADMGAVYAEGDWTLRGTVIEHNYFENIPSVGSLGAYAVYLDNGLSGITVKNNIFKDVERQAVYINGGRDNLVTNNIFVDTGRVGAISDIFNWGTGYSFENPAPAKDKLVKNLNKVNYKEEPYTKYENLPNILEDKPSIPMYNKFIGNVTVNSGGFTTSWLRNMTYDELISKAECEYDAKSLNVSDLTNYNGGDYTLNKSVAERIGFEWFDNSFGR